MVVAASKDDGEAFCLPLAPMFESIHQHVEATSTLSVHMNAAEEPKIKPTSCDQQAYEASPENLDTSAFENSHSRDEEGTLRSDHSRRIPLD